MGSSPVTPTPDPIYRFLERMAERGLVPLSAITTRPLTRQEITVLLHQLIDKALHLDDPILRADLEFFLKEFGLDLTFNYQNRSHSDSFKHISRDQMIFLSHWRLYKHLTESDYLVFDPIIAVGGADGGGKSVSRRSWGIQMYGAYQKVGGYFQFVDHTERGGGPYTDRSRLIEDRWGYVGPLKGGNETSYDVAYASLTFQWKGVKLLLGRDRPVWGGGYFTNLLFSDYPPPYDQFRLWWQPYHKVKFTYLLGKLYPWGLRDTLYLTPEERWRVLSSDKWIAAHRFEILAVPWLLVGLSEAVVWGERGWEWSYINPINFYYAAQHANGDQDNLLISGDVLMRAGKLGLLYASVVIDDLSTFTAGKGDVNNKLGWLLSWRRSQFGLRGGEIGVEYLRLEPFLYSHIYPINAYTHWKSPLGADLQPHSDRLSFWVEYRPYRWLGVRGEGARVRHSSLGGDREKPAPPELVREKIHFLSSNVTRYLRREILLWVEPFPQLKLALGGVRNARETTIPDRNYIQIGYRFN